MIKLYNIECSAKSRKKAIVGTYKTILMAVLRAVKGLTMKMHH